MYERVRSDQPCKIYLGMAFIRTVAEEQKLSFMESIYAYNISNSELSNF